MLILGSPIIFSSIAEHKEMVDDATSPLQLSLTDFAELNPPPLPKQKHDLIDDEPEEQEIYENNLNTGEFAHFHAPKKTSSSSLSRVEKARLLNAGFNVVLDEDGHRPVQVGSTFRNIHSIRIDFDLEKKDLRFNDVHMLYMGITFNSDLFEKFGGKIRFQFI